MLQICKYSEPASITPTNPDLAGDFRGSIKNGVVKDSSSRAFYNMQKEISEVGARISDEFDFIEYENALRTYRRAVEQND